MYQAKFFKLCRRFFTLILLLAFYVWTAWRSQKDQAFASADQLLRWRPLPSLEKLTFGQQYSLSDLHWLRVLQDFDFCEQKLVGPQKCVAKGWLYHNLDASLRLDPWYRIVYSAGALGLSVVLSDLEGASDLFNRAIQHYSVDWIILYKAAYHAIYEEHNELKGSLLLEQAARQGAPEWVYSLVSSYYKKHNKLDWLKQLAHSLPIELPEGVRRKIMQQLESSEVHVSPQRSMERTFETKRK